MTIKFLKNQVFNLFRINFMLFSFVKIKGLDTGQKHIVYLMIYPTQTYGDMFTVSHTHTLAVHSQALKVTIKIVEMSYRLNEK